MTTQAIFHKALVTILHEIFEGPPGDYAFLLNPGDPGLLRDLDAIDAATASNRPMPGRTTIAQHVAHVLYGIELLNRWAAGEQNPFATADWDAAWKTGPVDEIQWRQLLERLRGESKRWQTFVAGKTDGWSDIDAAGTLASAAHTAYHLGAIRQILAAGRSA